MPVPRTRRPAAMMPIPSFLLNPPDPATTACVLSGELLGLGVGEDSVPSTSGLGLGIDDGFGEGEGETVGFGVGEAVAFGVADGLGDGLVDGEGKGDDPGVEDGVGEDGVGFEAPGVGGLSGAL